MTIKQRDLEAVLFAAASPLGKEQLQEVFDATLEEVNEALAIYGASLDREERGIALRETGAGVELVTCRDSSVYVGKIREAQDSLSPAAVETLAIVAFKQPITKADIELLRGVNSERVLKQLVSRQLIEEVGRKDTIGRPVLYGTTGEFLRALGMTSLEDVKTLVPLEEEGQEEDSFLESVD